ncbi:hypothetical protein KF707_22405 [Candidatus Obscuribacterales bacterium]|nr:hypothetical protein [Candidatus Obscuribacterales bacterium]MBX3138996.1 hypothetical protein [Candidatus Obscuribacterales bacterium]
MNSGGGSLVWKLGLNDTGLKAAQDSNCLKGKGLTPEQLKDRDDLADEVFSDVYAHISGLRTSSYLSNFRINHFPKSVEFMMKELPRWKQAMRSLEAKK